MKNNKKNKHTSKAANTIWLDFISYIFIPFYILTLGLEVFKMTSSKIVIIPILVIIWIMFNLFLFYKLFKKEKLSYYLLYIFHPISISTIVLYFCNKINLNNTLYIIELVVVGLLLWTIPNYIYLFKRKDIFRKHNIAHIKKCPGCNRIIPVTMKSCGKCNYKEK